MIALRSWGTTFLQVALASPAIGTPAIPHSYTGLWAPDSQNCDAESTSTVSFMGSNVYAYDFASAIVSIRQSGRHLTMSVYADVDYAQAHHSETRIIKLTALARDRILVDEKPYHLCSKRPISIPVNIVDIYAPKLP